VEPPGARRLPAVATAAMLLALGCGEDGLDPGDGCPACAPTAPCRPPFSLAVVVEAPRQPISGAIATSPGLVCSGGNAFGIASCAAGTAEATYPVEVSATGYVSRQVTVTVGPRPAPDACGCQTACQSWEPTLVALVPAP
jgi:hypothetical protein